MAIRIEDESEEGKKKTHKNQQMFHILFGDLSWEASEK